MVCREHDARKISNDFLYKILKKKYVYMCVCLFVGKNICYFNVNYQINIITELMFQKN